MGAAAARTLANKEEIKERRPIHRFQPGESGNPLGRPKIAVAWRDQCRHFMTDEGGWDELKGIAKNRNHDNQLAALKVITEYAYGKPIQRAEIGEAGSFDELQPLREMVPEQLREILRLVS